MRAVKILFKIIAFATAGFFLLATLISVFYSKEIKQLIIAEINKNIETEIKVKEFDFSVLRHFPYASIEMKEVFVREVNHQGNNDTLLSAQRLALLFNIIGIFDKNVAVKKIIADNGVIHIRIDSTGKNNYHFWKSTNDSSKSSVIDIQKILLKNIDISYDDQKNHQNYNLVAEKAQISGIFSNDEFTLTTTADLFVKKLLVHHINYLIEKKVTIESGLWVNSKTKSYKLEKSTLKIADVEFDLNGTIQSPDDAVLFDLDIKSNEADLASFISLLPDPFASQLKSYKSKGKFVFHSTIKGESSKKKSPFINVDFSIANGSLSPKGKDVELTNINFSGNYKNISSTGKSALTIPSLTASLSGHPIKADIRIDDLDNAFLSLHASAQLDLAQVKPFINADTLETLSGNLALNIFYSGKLIELKNITKDNLYEVKASGNIDIAHLNFKLKNNPLQFIDITGKFILKNEDVEVRNFTGKISSTDFQLTGVFKNFIPFLLIHDQAGDFQANLISNNIILDEFLVNKSTSTSEDTSYILKFNPRLICDLNVNIGSMQFRKFKAAQVKGQIHLEHQIISGKNLSFNAMDGGVTMDATINAARKDSLFMTCAAKFSKLDITRLFVELENFEQTTLTDKNVKGRLSSDVKFSSSWAKDLSINPKKVIADCDITIENGELDNFLPIQAIAKFIKVPDLNHIRFSTLKNKINIANRKIFIPNMEINSSAINISGNGTHDFDNIVDYHIKLLLSDVLGKKAKSNQSEFGEIQDDGLGRTMLLLSMKGPVDNPKFAYDHKAAAEKIKREIANESQNLKSMLKEEFGLFKKDTVTTSKPKKKEEMQIDWNQE